MGRGPLRLAQLPELEGINPTMQSPTVAQLTRAGLITRRPGPAHRRAALLASIQSGRNLYRKILTERNHSLDQRLPALAAIERQLLIEAIPALEALAESRRDQDR